MKINVNDVITLNDNRQFLVLSETIHNEEKYFYIIELNENGQEIVDNVKIVKEVTTGDGSKLIIVKDHDEIDDVKESLVENLDKNELA
ncbi:MAG: hypothetical protein PHW32_04155 [Bacilli bacterium]|nr:hypothetical protein [Bacilli bacterium]MDD4719019.1 hypothetical protein [Bacilli bacterium]